MPQTPERKQTYSQLYYEKNKPQLQAKARTESVHKIKKIQALKVGIPCMDCGILYPSYVMDWDHRPDEIKLFAIYRAVTRPWVKILEEVAKCDLVCANCHRERTATRNGWTDANDR